MVFSATLTPPSGLSLPTKLAGASGTVYVPGSTSVTVRMKGTCRRSYRKVGALAATRPDDDGDESVSICSAAGERHSLP